MVREIGELVACVLGATLWGRLLVWVAGSAVQLGSGQEHCVHRVHPNWQPTTWQLVESLLRRETPPLTDDVRLSAGTECASAMLLGPLWCGPDGAWQLLRVTAVISLFLLIAASDLKYRLIPNVVVLPALAVVVASCQGLPARDILGSAVGASIGLFTFLLVAVLRPGTLGGGDVKLAALVGAAVGFPEVLFALSLGIVSGAVCAVYLLVGRRRQLSSAIPYGPFLCLGAVVSILFHPLVTLMPL